MYPYDNDELDEEERALNSQIKVGYNGCSGCSSGSTYTCPR